MLLSTARSLPNPEVAYASPHRLVQMLMEGALEKSPPPRAASNATTSREEPPDHLDVHHQRPAYQSRHGCRGAIAVNLDDLYAYTTRRLIDATAQNDANALSEVIDLLLEIKGAWDAMPGRMRNVGGTKYAAAKEAI